VGEGARDLARLVEDELFAPAPAAALDLVAEIRRQLGPATAAVVFYGSCLRRESAEGVHDFYAIVDAYRPAYRSRLLAWGNALLPPNVFYLEHPGPGGTLRAKYAVLSSRDLERATSPAALRTGVWARFCQPARALYVRDDAAREALIRCGTQSVLTALKRIAPLLPSGRDAPGATTEELWQRIFHETYSGEMRPETPETIQGLYRADAQRYDRAARAALAELEASGALRVERDADRFAIALPAGVRRRARLAWRVRRPLAKGLYLAQLVKSTLTFGDWLPYVLWKLERHTGTRLEPSPRQRRHPLIWGWPLLFRALWRRDFR
jgi:hypothetical protein